MRCPPNVNVLAEFPGPGADLNRLSPPQFGGTALHGAAFYGKAECVRLLISSGVDVNLKTNVRAALMEEAQQRSPRATPPPPADLPSAFAGRQDGVRPVVERGSEEAPRRTPPAGAKLQHAGRQCPAEAFTVAPPRSPVAGLSAEPELGGQLPGRRHPRGGGEAEGARASWAHVPTAEVIAAVPRAARSAGDSGLPRSRRHRPRSRSRTRRSARWRASWLQAGRSASSSHLRLFPAPVHVLAGLVPRADRSCGCCDNESNQSRCQESGIREDVPRQRSAHPEGARPRGGSRASRVEIPGLTAQDAVHYWKSTLPVITRPADCDRHPHLHAQRRSVRHRQRRPRPAMWILSTGGRITVYGILSR